MGFKDYSPEIALDIFSVAHKYQVRRCIEKCIEVLTPTEIDENMCHALNLSLFYDCEILFNRIMELIIDAKERCYIGREIILYNDKYLDLLEPIAVLKLLDLGEIDDDDINCLCDWGEKYLRKHSKVISLKSFFSENKIISKISLDCFTTAERVFKFIETDRTRGFFSDKEVLAFLKKRMLQKVDNEWVDVNAGEVLKECFVFVPPIPIIKKIVDNLDICRNQIIVNDTESLADDAAQVSYYLEMTHKVYDKTSDSWNNRGLFYCKEAQKKLNCFKEHSFKMRKKKFCRIPIDPFDRIKHDKLGITKVKIQYKFLASCRILKTYSKNLVPEDKNSNNKFFTYFIQPHFDMQ